MGEIKTTRDATDVGFVDTKVETSTYTRRHALEAWTHGGRVTVLVGTPSNDRREMVRNLDMLAITGGSYELSPDEAREFGERLIRLADEANAQA